jgi:hypothetical protein
MPDDTPDMSERCRIDGRKFKEIPIGSLEIENGRMVLRIGNRESLPPGGVVIKRDSSDADAAEGK